MHSADVGFFVNYRSSGQSGQATDERKGKVDLLLLLSSWLDFFHQTFVEAWQPPSIGTVGGACNSTTAMAVLKGS